MSSSPAFAAPASSQSPAAASVVRIDPSELQAALMGMPFFKAHCKTVSGRMICEIPPRAQALAEARPGGGGDCGSTVVRTGLFPEVRSTLRGVEGPLAGVNGVRSSDGDDDDDEMPDAPFFFPLDGVSDIGKAGKVEIDSLFSGGQIPGRSRSFQLGQTYIQLTVLDGLEFHVIAGGWQGQVNDQGTRSTQQALGSTTFGTMARLYDNDRSGTQAGMELELTVPTSRYAVKSGFSEPGWVLTPTAILSQKIGDGTALHASIGNDFSSRGRGEGNIAVALAQVLGKSLTAYLETIGQTPGQGEGGAKVSVGGGLQYQATPHIAVGIGVMQDVLSRGTFGKKGTLVVVGLQYEREPEKP